MWQSYAIRIACLDEVSIIAHEDIRHHVILWLPVIDAVGRQIAHSILYISRVDSAMNLRNLILHDFLSLRLVLHTTCQACHFSLNHHLRALTAVKVTVYRLAACSVVDIAPSPCAVCEEKVSAKVYARLLVYVVRSCDAIKGQHLVSIISEHAACCLCDILHGYLSSGHRDVAKVCGRGHLKAVAAYKERNTHLTSCCICRKRLFCQEMVVNIIYRNISHICLLHKHLCRHFAHLLDILIPHAPHHLHTCFLSFSETLHPLVCNDRTARPDGLGEQASRQWRSHQRTNRH